MTTEALFRLQDWYLAHCDGEWEHSYGVKINTLDNPGWELIVDLDHTELADEPFKAVERESDDRDWIRCQLRGSKFEAAGGPLNLQEIIDTFLTWAARG
jgi:hypothetical protein